MPKGKRSGCKQDREQRRAERSARVAAYEGELPWQPLRDGSGERREHLKTSLGRPTKDIQGLATAHPERQSQVRLRANATDYWG